MKKISELNTKIFSDGADISDMRVMSLNPIIKGLTTNPTLMKKAGIKDYRAFGKEILSFVKEKPISFEVFSDDFLEMERQALEISSWGDNVYVKIPITNTLNISCSPLIRRLADQKVKINVTAIMNLNQVEEVSLALNVNTASYISVFAGRIADTGRNPVPLMKSAVELLKKLPNAELIWASPRELLNIFQADEVGCHNITVTSDILRKLSLVGYDLGKYSLDTVKMFHNDALDAGFKI